MRKDEAQWTRRSFLGKAAALSAAGVAFPTIIPRTALAQGDRPGANDRIGVAGIGVGRQGSGIFRGAASHRLAQAICVCDVNRPRAESVAQACGAKNVYQDYRRVLEMTGWGTHGFDKIQWSLGLDATGPTEIPVEGPALEMPVYSEPEDLRRGNTICSQPRLSYRYANGITVRLENANRGGGIFMGEKGKMEVFRGRLTSNPDELAKELLETHLRPVRKGYECPEV